MILVKMSVRLEKYDFTNHTTIDCKVHRKILPRILQDIYGFLVITFTCLYYRRRGNIRWAKHQRFQPYEIFAEHFHGALTTSIHYLPICKNSRQNFCSKLKNHENRKNLAH